MKKRILLLLTITLSLGAQTFAQSNLYVGYRGGSTTNGNQLARIDTTGGVITFIGNTTLSTDFGAGTVFGVYGLAVQPFTEEVYALYDPNDTDSDGADRRLGTINLATATITDIGEIGAANDLTFVDTTLYGSMGSLAGNQLVTVNTATAEISSVLAYGTPHGGSSAINFDYHKSRILRTIQSSDHYTSINVNEMEEESLVHGGAHPGWSTSLLTLDNETAYSLGNVTIQLLNTNTFAYTSVFSFPSSNYIHSAVFGSYPLSLWVNGNRNMCAGDESTLTVVGSGTDFEWYKDGIEIDGETASTLVVSEAGEYEVIVDGKTLNSVTITVAPSIADGFTISANPAYIGAGPEVSVDFSANASGTRYTYDWDSGAGETADIKEPTFTYSDIDNYLVTLIVTDTLTRQQCALEIIKNLAVVGGVGIDELTSELNIYPIPANDELFVEFPAENYTIQLVDLSGAIVLNQQVTNSVKTAVQVSDLESGTYICKIIGTDYVIERMFVKQ